MTTNWGGIKLAPAEHTRRRQQQRPMHRAGCSITLTTPRKRVRPLHWLQSVPQNAATLGEMGQGALDAMVMAVLGEKRQGLCRRMGPVTLLDETILARHGGMEQGSLDVMERGSLDVTELGLLDETAVSTHGGMEQGSQDEMVLAPRREMGRGLLDEMLREMQGEMVLGTWGAMESLLRT